MEAQNAERPGMLHVAELARIVGVTPATIRYYARCELIQPSREPVNGYRCFSARDVDRVAFIRRAKKLGLTIGDIKSILDASDNGEVPRDQVIALTEHRLLSIRDRIAALQATEKRIGEALAIWDRTAAQVPMDGEICPLIERLHGLSDNSLRTLSFAANGMPS